MQENKPDHVPPSWHKYPGSGPGDGFWRQSGQAWLKDVWQPYFDTLTTEEQTQYVKDWNVPGDWLKFYVGKELSDLTRHG